MNMDLEIVAENRLIRELDWHFGQVLQVAKQMPEQFWYQQFHADLSPMAWHLGHCAFIESHWIRHQMLGDDSYTREQESLYLPWLSPKATRGDRIPEAHTFIRELMDSHAQNMELLSEARETQGDHALLQHDYLSLFLIQHHAQHCETMQQVLLCYYLQQHNTGEYTAIPFCATAPALPDLSFASATIPVGDAGNAIAYDNELPRHEIALAAYTLARGLVSNAEYLGFMEQDGYGNPAYWSVAGWQWRQSLRHPAPLHWRQDIHQHWYQITPSGTAELVAEKAVTGINRHEAQAFARYAGSRLPHENEWEHAVMASAAEMTIGEAWEWCDNTFYPYPGFRAFPYDGYSKHWFDNRHYSLRGGSDYTSNRIRRPTFRNFYTAEKRHIFAGLRLCQ